MKKAFVLLCLMLASFSYLAAQNVVKGTVVDTDGNPIPGVKVEIVGSAESVLTELDGTFELQSETPFKKVRVIYSGMQTKVASVKPDLVIKMSKTSWWNRKPEKYQWIVSPQVVFPENGLSNPAFGLMVARVKDIGFYGKFLYSPSVGDYEISDGSWPWTTGEDKRSYMAVTAGFIYRLKCPIHVYVGAGYVDRQVVWQISDGTYRRNSDYSYRSGVLDAGLMLRCGRFSLNGGMLMDVEGANFAANFGVGFSF